MYKYCFVLLCFFNVYAAARRVAVGAADIVIATSVVVAAGVFITISVMVAAAITASALLSLLLLILV